LPKTQTFWLSVAVVAVQWVAEVVVVVVVLPSILFQLFKHFHLEILIQ
jgi:hypothetical protein